MFDLKIFAGNACRSLAGAIARALGVPLGEMETLLKKLKLVYRAVHTEM